MELTLTRAGDTNWALARGPHRGRAGGRRRGGDMAVTTPNPDGEVDAGESTEVRRFLTIDNRVTRGPGQVTATIAAGPGYAIETGEGAATVNVTDNDADGQRDLSLTGTIINEGGSETVTVVISNGHTLAVAEDVKLHWNTRTLMSGLFLNLQGAKNFDALTLPAEEASVSARCPTWKTTGGPHIQPATRA